MLTVKIANAELLAAWNNPLVNDQQRLLILAINQNEVLQTFTEKIMATLEDVKAAVAALKETEVKVVGLLDELHAKLVAAIAANDPAAIQEVADGLGTINAEANAALARNAS